MGLIRGTTPTLVFSLPLYADQLVEAYVTIAQHGEVVIDKPLKECDCRENILSVKLTQEETLMLDCSCTSEMQIRAKTVEGEAIASDIISIFTARILKEGVI